MPYLLQRSDLCAQAITALKDTGLDTILNRNAEMSGTTGFLLLLLIYRIIQTEHLTFSLKSNSIDRYPSRSRLYRKVLQVLT